MKIYSPNNIEVLLHYHTNPTVHPRIHAPAVADATAMLFNTGCIEPDQDHDGQYRTTQKGKAWVKALCNVEIPREAYVDEHGNILG